MNFNVGKFSILCEGGNNPSHNHCLNDTPISKSGWERDSVVLVRSNLRPKMQCIQDRKRINTVLSLLLRNVRNRSTKLILELYLGLVRPHLDCVVQFWSTYCKKNIKMLESVQNAEHEA